jgi:2,4-dienoyl-CoA reductase (NADPH2)
MQNRTDALFTPYPLGPHVLKNRLVALPVYTGYAHPSGRVSPLMLDHYARLAASGAAMVVVANAAVAEDGRTSRFCLRIDSDDHIDGLSALAQTIKREDAVACLQLNHAGALAWLNHPRQPAPPPTLHLGFKISALKRFMEFFPLEHRFGLTQRFLKQAHKWREGMTDAGRAQIIAAFCQAAVRARHAGFDMIELHGANGYLICQFLSAFTHGVPPRTDDVFAHLTAFPLALLNSVKQHLPSDFPVGFRLILDEWVPDGIDLQQALRFARLLEKAGISYISSSAGTFNSIFRPDIRTRMSRPGYLRQEVAALHRQVRTPVIISGRILAPGQASRLIEDNTADLIGLGRALRIDPDWVRKARSAQRRIRACINCLWCLRQVVLDKGFTCRLWPEAERQRTRLAHMLMQRNDTALCVVAGPGEAAAVKSALRAIQPAAQGSAPHFLWIAGNFEEQALKAEQEALQDWMAVQYPGSRPAPYLAEGATASPDRQVREAIERYDFGMVLLTNGPDRQWRTRLCHQLRQRVVALVRPFPTFKRILVAVDMSDSTLLILAFLKTFIRFGPDADLKLVHIAGRSDPSIHRKWKQMKTICGWHGPHLPLEVVTTEMETAEAIAQIARDPVFDTVILGKRGASGIKRRLMGSVSAKVLRRLPRHTVFFVD